MSSQSTSGDAPFPLDEDAVPFLSELNKLQERSLAAQQRLDALRSCCEELSTQLARKQQQCDASTVAALEAEAALLRARNNSARLTEQDRANQIRLLQVRADSRQWTKRCDQLKAESESTGGTTLTPPDPRDRIRQCIRDMPKEVAEATLEPVRAVLQSLCNSANRLAVLDYGAAMAADTHTAVRNALELSDVILSQAEEVTLCCALNAPQLA